MKIRPEHYAFMRDTIAKRVTKEQVDAHREAVRVSGRFTDLEKRIRWDVANATRTDDGKRLTTWFCSLYDYVNDDHIDTALKAVMKELNFAAQAVAQTARR